MKFTKRTGVWPQNSHTLEVSEYELVALRDGLRDSLRAMYRDPFASKRRQDEATILLADMDSDRLVIPESIV